MVLIRKGVASVATPVRNIREHPRLLIHREDFVDLTA